MLKRAAISLNSPTPGGKSWHVDHHQPQGAAGKFAKAKLTQMCDKTLFVDCGSQENGFRKLRTCTRRVEAASVAQTLDDGIGWPEEGKSGTQIEKMKANFRDKY